VLTPDALAFLGELHGRFDPRRVELPAVRRERMVPEDFLLETRDVREADWQGGAAPSHYADRRVEITGPTDRKLVIYALNSGAKGFMADFEDANSPTWRNQAEGHINLIDAIEATITYESSEGRGYELGPNPATLLVRPRGWHLLENHLRVDKQPIAGAFMDFGLYARSTTRSGCWPARAACSPKPRS
jgi:malate synthase